GRVLYVPMKDVNAKTGEITFEDEDGSDVTISVTGGNAKLQWKPDFGMRWAALGVDFEMFGKDHQANAPIYSKICRILGERPPEQYVYELFLDEKGEKISKSKGNGISVEQWLKYAPQESLALFMWQKPRAAKKLYFDVIPKAVDEYLTFVEKYHSEEPAKQLENPAWAIHSGKVPELNVPVSFALLLNLVSAANANSKELIWGFISKYAADATPENAPFLDQLVGYALSYYEDFVKPEKEYRAPSAQERAALEELAASLRSYDGPVTGEDLQTLTFTAGKNHAFENLRDWFKALYQTLLGQDQGPRFGSFVALYGIKETKALINQALAGELTATVPA
ncbi:MAG TPA: lysine--tRNA ligase, partial [Rhodospirillaceae bacterium]|nr:lysine--tRNA ligase [Rhodospirillaceae bacterium]